MRPPSQRQFIVVKNLPIVETPEFFYVASNDAASVLNMYARLADVYRYLGMEHRVISVQRGSVLARISSWFGHNTTAKDAMVRGARLVDGADAWLNSSLQEATARVDNMNANSLAQLLQAAGDTDFVNVFHGFLAMRITRPDGTCAMVTRPLSPKETLALQTHPEILDDPTNFLQALRDVIQLEEMASLETAQEPE